MILGIIDTINSVIPEDRACYFNADCRTYLKNSDVSGYYRWEVCWLRTLFEGDVHRATLAIFESFERQSCCILYRNSSHKLLTRSNEHINAVSRTLPLYGSGSIHETS